MGFSQEVKGAPSQQLAKPRAAAPEAQHSDPIKSTSQFCGLLKKRVGPAKICLAARAGKIFQLRDLAGVDDDIAKKQSISLADVLKRHKLVEKTKLLLAYTLAKSFWQFYSSDWMGSCWTTSTLQFFPERRDDDADKHGDIDCILYGSPYFALSAQKQDSFLSAEFLPTESVVHRYPRVLALGTMLLEIGRQKRARGRQGTLQHQPGSVSSDVATPEEKISTDLHEIRSALKWGTCPEFDIHEEVRQTYRAVLRNCSDPKLFEAAAANMLGENGALTIEERRAIIYREIVYPLQLLLEKLGWIDRSGKIKDEDQEEGSSSGIKDDGIIDSKKPTNRPGFVLT